MTLSKRITALMIAFVSAGAILGCAEIKSSHCDESSCEFGAICSKASCPCPNGDTCNQGESCTENGCKCGTSNGCDHNFACEFDEINNKAICTCGGQECKQNYICSDSKQCVRNCTDPNQLWSSEGCTYNANCKCRENETCLDDYECLCNESKCSSQEACNDQHECQECAPKCQAGEICTIQGCVKDTRCDNVLCNNGLTCREGKCVCGDSTKACDSQETCYENKCVPCSPACEKGQICTSIGCIADPCQHVKCSTGETCVDGICLCGGVANAICSNQENCAQNSDTDGLYKCTACIPGCADGEKCTENGCVKYDPCDYVITNAGESCINGKRFCGNRYACDDNEQCNNGVCTCGSQTCKENEWCSTASKCSACIPECKEDELCQNGVCVTKECSMTCGHGKTCTFVGDEMKCLFNDCDNRECDCANSDKKCKDNQACSYEGKCVDPVCVNHVCETNKECANLNNNPTCVCGNNLCNYPSTCEVRNNELTCVCGNNLCNYPGTCEEKNSEPTCVCGDKLCNYPSTCEVKDNIFTCITP